MAEPVAGALNEAQVGAPVGLGELTGVARRNTLVVLAVHDQQRTGGEATGRSDGTEPAERPRPLVERGWEPRCPDRADLAGVIEEASGVIGPIVEVGAGRQQPDRRDPRIISADTDRDRPSGVGAEQHDLAHARGRRQVVDRRSQVVGPALQREVARAGATSRGT